jgi:hypothetical protein
LRRVDWIRLVVAGGTTRAQAVGVGFRLPVSWPIPMAVAAGLIEAGTPHVVHRQATDAIVTEPPACESPSAPH